MTAKRKPSRKQLAKQCERLARKLECLDQEVTELIGWRSALDSAAQACSWTARKLEEQP